MANAPESIAWLAMIAARMATTKVGQNNGPKVVQRVDINYAMFVKQVIFKKGNRGLNCLYLGWIYRRYPQHSLGIS
jgi:hypothetical protein